MFNPIRKLIAVGELVPNTRNTSATMYGYAGAIQAVSCVASYGEVKPRPWTIDFATVSSSDPYRKLVCDIW